jgi:hypothetical protein
MTPAQPAARRIALLGCALAAAAALLLPGCGEDGAATAGSAGATQAKTSEKPRTATGGCPSSVDSFVKSLDALRRQLAVGLSYERYAARVKALKSSYDKVPIDRLTIDCLSATGTPAEAALNKYIDAADAWGECLADASCGTATIEPVLQRKWRLASRSLSEAQ